MSVLSPQQLAERVALQAANLDVQAGKVRDTLGRWSPPPEKKPKPEPADEAAEPSGTVNKPTRGARVLIVAATLDEAEQLAAKLRASMRTDAVELTTVATHGSLIGRAFDVVVYRPGWRGIKRKASDPHPAADEWRRAIVKTRTIHPGVELYL